MKFFIPVSTVFLCTMAMAVPQVSTKVINKTSNSFDVLVSVVLDSTVKPTVKPTVNPTVVPTVNPPQSTGSTYFAPYVDATGWPYFDFKSVPTGVKKLTLAFIVSRGNTECVPSWGGYPNLGVDETEIGIKGKLQAFRQLGKDAIISFGGAAGNPLEATCKDAVSLKNAVKSVVDAYSLKEIDFDIEGGAVANPANQAKLGQAIKLLQAEYPKLLVWLTLPVMPDGLDNNGVNTVKVIKANGGRIDGVNVMAMDYGPECSLSNKCGDFAIGAATGTFNQLKSIYGYGDAQTWKMVGICPMIGENDVPNEVFSLADATKVANFAVSKNIGSLAFWSMNRDKQCPGGVDLPSCTGVKQAQYAYANIFAKADSTVIKPVDPSTNPTPVPEMIYDVTATAANKGLTGQWWCDNHFGYNLGGTWLCTKTSAATCTTDIPVNTVVTCKRTSELPKKQ